mmetsp:Transcript_43267/g.106816  ORF Transcript_43267/g.106816 Transcript_43267/m.106816 type:complete len:334 (-) Transcript_43267:1259-2260(-)
MGPRRRSKSIPQRTKSRRSLGRTCPARGVELAGVPLPRPVAGVLGFEPAQARGRKIADDAQMLRAHAHAPRAAALGAGEEYGHAAHCQLGRGRALDHALQPVELGGTREPHDAHARARLEKVALHQPWQHARAPRSGERAPLVGGGPGLGELRAEQQQVHGALPRARREERVRLGAPRLGREHDELRRLAGGRVGVAGLSQAREQKRGQLGECALPGSRLGVPAPVGRLGPREAEPHVGARAEERARVGGREFLGEVEGGAEPAPLLKPAVHAREHLADQLGLMPLGLLEQELGHERAVPLGAALGLDPREGAMGAEHARRPLVPHSQRHGER